MENKTENKKPLFLLEAKAFVYIGIGRFPVKKFIACGTHRKFLEKIY